MGKTILSFFRKKPKNSDGITTIISPENRCFFTWDNSSDAMGTANSTHKHTPPSPAFPFTANNPPSVPNCPFQNEIIRFKRSRKPWSENTKVAANKRIQPR